MVYITMFDASLRFKEKPSAFPATLSMDLLRTFEAAARLGGFTSAGLEVGRTQSAVSMQMKRLEEELGCALFVRSGRAVRPTPQGEALLGYARRLLRLNDEAVASLAASGLSGTVRLGVPDDYALRYLPDVLARFARAHPLVRVDVLCDTSPRLLERLRVSGPGGLDLCVATHNEGNMLGGDMLGGDMLARLPLVWAVAEGRTLADLRPEADAPLPLAVFHEGCLIRAHALAALERAHIPYRIALGSMSLAAILSSVRSGLTVAPVTIASLEPGVRALGGHEDAALEQDDSGMPALPPLPAVAVALHRRATGEQDPANTLARFLGERFAGATTA
ncbi:MAG: LysR family transcriptional regulator [Desulfovibrionaceae bacterium]